MKYSVSTYARNNSKSPRDIFRDAWRHVYKTFPGNIVEEQVQSYLKTGATPQYVTKYIQDHSMKKTYHNFTPWWAAMA